MRRVISAAPLSCRSWPASLAYILYTLLKCRLKVDSDDDDVTNDGKLFHARAAATGKARSPIVLRRVTGTTTAVDELEPGTQNPSRADVSRTTDAVGEVHCQGWHRSKERRTVPSRPPYGRLFPKIGGAQPHPKLQLLLSQEREKLRTSNLARYIEGSI